MKCYIYLISPAEAHMTYIRIVKERVNMLYFVKNVIYTVNYSVEDEGENHFYGYEQH